MRDIEKTVTASQLSAGCADLYIDFTRDWILKPAGAFATRTRAPQNPKSVNFAYLYNWNDHSTQGLMPDRRLNIGSGGWAMSAKEYGKFLSALFDEELLSANIKVGNSWFNTIDYMKANNLGMFPAWGSTNEEYYQHRGANTYTTNSGEYGGQSVWMHFPSTNMCAVVQINCNANILKFDSTVAGLDNTSVVLNAQWSENWRIMRFFRTSAGTFNFRYNPENGWMRIQSIRDNGTFDDVVTSSNGGWLRERSADGPFRPATSGWDTAEFYIARDVVIDPIPPREVQSLPNPQGNSSDLIVEIPPVTRPDLVKLEAPTPTTRFVRGQIQLNWMGSRDVLYFIEKSEDLSNWSPAGLLEGNGEPLQWSRQLLEEDPNNTGEFLPKFFYRIRTIEGAPEEPIVGQPGAPD